MLVVTTSWSRFGAPDGLFPADELRHGIHGGAVETSIMLARHPELVRTRRDRRFRLARRGDGGAISLAVDAAAGAVGLADAGSQRERRRRRRNAGHRGKGEQLIAHGARAFCELLVDVDKFDVKQLAKGPKSSKT